MKSKRMKTEQEKGITLIALVITVVILIILATVTLNVVLGEGGLIKRAQQAKDLTDQAQKDEQDELKGAEEFINGVLEDTTKAKSLAQAFKDGEIQVGDYVDYTPDPHEPITVGTDKTGFTDSEGKLGTTNQTYSQDTTNTHWRVLGLTEDGNSVMLLGSPIKQDGANENPIKRYFFLEGATGYKNCENTLNEICSIYHNNSLAQETRSIKIEDINRALGGITVTYPEENEPETGTVTLNTDSSNTNIGGVTSYPSYTYKSGDYSPESYPSTVDSNQIGTKVQAKGYYYNVADLNGINYSYLKNLGSTINERGYYMLFEDILDSKPYLLASSGINAYGNYAYFGPGVVTEDGVYLGIWNFLTSNGYTRGDLGAAIRPVVILKSNITVNDVHKIKDQVEEEW